MEARFLRVRNATRSAEQLRTLRELAELTDRVERAGPGTGALDEQLRFVQLYLDAVAAHPDDGAAVDAPLKPAVSDDALAESMVIARAHGALFRPAPRRLARTVITYLRDDFPDALWRERKLVALALALFLVGGVIGAAIVETDHDALSVVLPEIHQAQAPLERVRADLRRQEFDAFRALEFASFLFTHNIEVGFLFFSLGLSFGLGTAVALLWNGVPIGALAAQYHGSGLGTFFWAWILPHGLLELSALAIAGGAGFVLARGMLRPGRDRVGVALAREARTAIPLVVGTIPMLIVAGLIEGTLSQMHGSIAPAPAKLGVAALSLVSFAVLVARRRPRKNGATEG